jgi:hypothetical protein
MRTPSLWMITAGCFGPGICRTDAIWLCNDVKRTATARARAKHTWPAIAGFLMGCALGAACEPAFGLRSLAPPTAVFTSRVSIGPCCQSAARRWPQFAAGRGIVIDHRNRSDGLEKVRLAQSKMDTSEPEPTQTDVTDQHG